VTNRQDLTFFQRYEFFIRRLHSLSGLVPVGAFLCVHLIVNASVLNSAATYQQNVYSIHWLDSILPVVEWLFIFLPIFFHGLFGFVIMWSGRPNNAAYPYPNNIRFTLQRATGIIAFLFIVWHVLHMHGWFHMEWWLESIAFPLGGSKFRPFNATSTAAIALQASYVVQALYAIGVIACVYHLANGIWTMSITWGVCISAAAQVRMTIVCTVFGVTLGVIGLGSLWGLATADVQKAVEMEDRMYESKVQSGEMRPNKHKRAESLPGNEEDEE